MQYISKLLAIVRQFTSLFISFCTFFAYYIQKHVVQWSYFFEKQKNRLVRFFMIKRGRYNRPFLHISAMTVIMIGILLAPFLADTYPLLTQGARQFSPISDVQAQQESITVDNDVFKTEISQKPRDKVIIYRVTRGDTISTIAQKFGVSEETVRWANNLTSDNISIDDELKILPVTGLSHKVEKGDTIYSLAKKYDANPQAIVDFPFNEFANPQTFSLVVGQILIVPDGVRPQERPAIQRQVYIVKGPVSVTSAGFTWPVRGMITQFSSWYHTALDIAAPIGTPILAGQSGKVAKVSVGTWDGGYGTNVIVSDGSGNETLYSHLSDVNISAGNDVVAGKTVLGWIGMTGRTTGPHVHFEIRKNGALVNPLPYLQ